MEAFDGKDLMLSNPTRTHGSSQLHGFIYVHLIYTDYLLVNTWKHETVLSYSLANSFWGKRKEENGPSQIAWWLCPMEDPSEALILFRSGFFLTEGFPISSPFPTAQQCQMLTAWKGGSRQRPHVQIIQAPKTESCSNMQPLPAIPTKEESRQPTLCRTYQKRSLLWKSTAQDQGLAQMQKQKPRVLRV